MQIDGFYAVEPKMNCPHILETKLSECFADFTLDNATAFMKNPCEQCDVADENWICLSCGLLGCSRYKNSHMQAHNAESRHPLAISLSDLSTWCYDCNAYIVSPKIRNIHSMLYLAKFEELPPNAVAPLDLPEMSSQTYPAPTPIHNDLPEDTSNPNATGHLKKESIQEYKDEEDVLDAKIDELALLFKNASKIVTFTGAGISTSANIPDYRGPNGVWTRRDRGLQPDRKGLNLDQAQPTPTHISIKAIHDMADKDLFVVSTNIDGLHVKSGLPAEALSELHGNVYKECCCLCNKIETRDFVIRADKNATIDFKSLDGKMFDRTRLSHATGRKCECGGYYCDTIINFGEDLPPQEVQKSVNKSTLADLSLVLGTSMRVSPANQLPSLAQQNGGKLVIINLQNTPFDSQCAVRIWAPTDVVFSKLFSKLGVELTN